MSQFESILEKYTEKTNKYNQKKYDCINYASFLITKITNDLSWPEEKVFYILLKDKSKDFTDENITKVNYLNVLGTNQKDTNKIVAFSDFKINFLQVNLCLELSTQTKNNTKFDNSININFVFSVFIKEKDNEICVQTSLNEDLCIFSTKMNYDQNTLRISQAIIKKIEDKLDEFYFIKQNQEKTKILYIEL